MNDYLMTIILAEIDLHEKAITRFSEELRESPDGSISEKIIKGKKYFYHLLKCTQSGILRQVYIPKKDKELIIRLLRKKYLQKGLKKLKSNIKVLRNLAEKYKPFFHLDTELKSIRDSYSTDENFNYFSKDKLLNTWASEHFDKLEIYPERLVHSTYAGLKVRSKSEALIAGFLEMNEIPFRYEAKLEIMGQKFFPDFTVLKQRDGEILYWEHFGMINDDKYNQSMERKHTFFIRHGLIPWRNYIATYDSADGAIDALVIQNIIKAFIL